VRRTCPVCNGTRYEATPWRDAANVGTGMPCPGCFGTGIQDDEPQKFYGGITFPDPRVAELERELARLIAAWDVVAKELPEWDREREGAQDAIRRVRAKLAALAIAADFAVLMLSTNDSVELRAAIAAARQVGPAAPRGDV